ncbi:hypothetical protein LOD99_7192 [Oopsacas minuta]|uniref:FPL domain-containing protein n=1 Tax=Oopsacas minuta TaxID=111878 RepID=A0AAV7JUD0_9METZ|nr:hypothetical protein LOD99_7192 [Oopsacas minuta]
MAEILIWGDQNDSSVFDYFLEKNMQSFFLDILNQGEGASLSVQILQTLNILFENTHKETSIYYLMSNDHITSIISYPFNFENEENLAYYISFLKTLSMKLNIHTIHLFFNEVKHLSHFPLYTEAIKFFDHPESMVRIAVRTLTLNVFRVENKDMLSFICNKTATSYFSNLVYFIGNHALQFDRFLQKDASHLTLSKLESLTEGHLDEILYIQDIIFLRVVRLSEILRSFILNNLTIPLYLRSLTPLTDSVTSHPSDLLSVHTALFLLTQILLNMEDEKILNTLVSCLINKTPKTLSNFYYCPSDELNSPERRTRSSAQFMKPNLSVVQTLSSLSLQAKFQCYVPSVERQSGSPHSNLINSVYDDFMPQLNLESSHNTSMLPTKCQSSDLSLRRAHSSKTSNETMPFLLSQQMIGLPFEKLSLIDPVNQTSNNILPTPSSEAVETTGELIHPLGSTEQSLLRPIPQYPVLDQNTDGDALELDDIFLTNISNDEVPITSPPKLETVVRDLITTSPDLPSSSPSPPPDLLLSIIQSELESLPHDSTPQTDRPFISLSLHLLTSMPDDRNVLLSCGLLLALFSNKAIDPNRLASLVPTPGDLSLSFPLIDIILNAIENIFHSDNCSRLLTLELLIHLYSQLRTKYTFNLSDHQIARLESIKEASISQLRLCYSGPHDVMFADTLDLEFTDVLANKIRIMRVLNDPSILLPPCPTPLSGVELSKRLPCGENEMCRSKIRTFCLIRRLYSSSLNIEEDMLPLIPTSTSVSEKETINLSNCELVYCLLPTKSGQMLKRFIGIHNDEFVLVEAKQEQISKGVVHYIACVKHVTLTYDKEDKLRLDLRIHKPGRATSYLSTSLVFQDSIRCMAAMQALHRATQKFKYECSVSISTLLSLPPPPPQADASSLSVTQSIMRNFKSQTVPLLASSYQSNRTTVQNTQSPIPADDDFVHVDSSQFICPQSPRSSSTSAFLQPEQIFAPSSYPSSQTSPKKNPNDIELSHLHPKPNSLL